jgi:predicted ArsR family transcriptional regulator
MALKRWDQRFFESTRGRVVARLRRRRHTVEELAQELELTDNAIRAHLATLERDGIVRQQGLRRGGGKPSFDYDLTPDAEALFPKAYEPVLRELIGAIEERLGAGESEALLRAVGRRLAVHRGSPDDALRVRVDAATALLGELGGLAEVEEVEGGGYIIRGYSCPLAAIVPGNPAVCQLAETLLAESVGVPVCENCDRSDRPRCEFQIAMPGNGTGAPTPASAS